MFPLRDQYLSCLGIESDEDLEIFEQQMEKQTVPKVCILHYFWDLVVVIIMLLWWLWIRSLIPSSIKSAL